MTVDSYRQIKLLCLLCISVYSVLCRTTKKYCTVCIVLCCLFSSVLSCKDLISLAIILDWMQIVLLPILPTAHFTRYSAYNTLQCFGWNFFTEPAPRPVQSIGRNIRGSVVLWKGDFWSDDDDDDDDNKVDNNSTVFLFKKISIHKKKS